MASLRARHSKNCALKGRETAAPSKEREKIKVEVDGKTVACTCKPTYSIRGAQGDGHEKIGKDLRDALRALNRRNVAIEDGEYVPQSNVKFKSWSEEWLDGLERPKANTVDGYRETLRYANEAFGSVIVRKLGPGHVKTFLGLMKEAKLADSTRAKHLRVLHACMSSAVTAGYAAQNPVKRIQKSEKPRPQKKEAAYFENDELPRLFAEFAPGLYATLYRTALKTGMREGELAALTWRDVDLVGSVIRVRHSYTAGQHGTPKSHEKRTVDINPDLVDVLAKWKESNNPSETDLVFPAEDEDSGGFLPYWRFTRVLYAAMKRAGIERVGPTGEKRTFHSFRHTYAKVALENGASVFWLSRQLGHSSVQVTTNLYGHWERKAAKAEAAKLAAAFTV